MLAEFDFNANANSIGNCRPDQFTCKFDSNTCIAGNLVCDGIFDCPDRSDESFCHQEIRNRTKKDELAANRMAHLLGLLKHHHHTHTHKHEKKHQQTAL